MAYTTIANVQADFKDMTFSSTTNVTDADVTQFIVEADALINSYVGQVYQVPVTASASSLALLSLFSRTLVADRIKKIIEVKQLTNNKFNLEGRGAYSTKDVMAQLSAIRDQDLNLDGATLLDAHDGFFSSNASAGIVPEITKSTKEW